MRLQEFYRIVHDEKQSEDKSVVACRAWRFHNDRESCAVFEG
jgi:hypothetical protein